MLGLHEKVTSCLKSADPFGPYDALVSLGGGKVAERLGIKGECRRRIESVVADSPPRRQIGREVVVLSSDEE